MLLKIQAQLAILSWKFWHFYAVECHRHVPSAFHGVLPLFHVYTTHFSYYRDIITCRYAWSERLQWLAVPFAMTNPAVSNVTGNADHWIGTLEPIRAGIWIDSALLLVFGGIPWQVGFKTFQTSGYTQPYGIRETCMSRFDYYDAGKMIQ